MLKNAPAKHENLRKCKENTWNSNRFSRKCNRFSRNSDCFAGRVIVYAGSV